MIIKVVTPYQPARGRNVEKVDFEWYELGKRRLKKISSAGREIGFALESPLQDGDILWQDDTTVIYAQVVPCKLVEIEVKDIKSMGKICFIIGNNHLPLRIEATKVVIPYERPILHYLRNSGFTAKVIHDKFTDYMVCHGHGHSSKEHQH